MKVWTLLSVTWFQCEHVDRRPAGTQSFRIGASALGSPARKCRPAKTAVKPQIRRCAHPIASVSLVAAVGGNGCPPGRVASAMLVRADCEI